MSSIMPVAPPIIGDFDEIPEDDMEQLTEGDEVLNEDQFHKLTSRHLELKTYFFPTGKPRIIPISSIVTVYHQTQSASNFLKTNNWGMGAWNVWWASDMKRCLRQIVSKDKFSNVVIDCGECTSKGFTVANIDTFLEGLTSVRKSGLVIKNQLPWKT